MALLQHFNYFHTGKFYSYAYSPKWLNRLSVYDKYPLLLFVNYDNIYGLVSGINMHWLTVAQRAHLIDIMTRLYEKEDLQDWGKAIGLSWNVVKQMGPAYKMAWRKYFPSRIRNIKAVATSWDFNELKTEVVNNNTQQVLGVTPEFIQRHYAESLARKLRGENLKAKQTQQTINKNLNQNIVW